MKDDSSLADNENNIKEKFYIEDDKIMLEYYIYDPDGEDDIIEEPENVLMKNYKKQIIKVEAVEDKNGGDLEYRISKTYASDKKNDNKYTKNLYNIRYDKITKKIEMKDDSFITDNENKIKEKFGINEKNRLEYYIFDPNNDDDLIDEPEITIMKDFIKFTIRVEAIED